MRPPRPAHARLLALALLCAACERPKAAPPVDTVVALPVDSGVVVQPAVEATSGWDATAGTVMYVARPDRPGVASVVFPNVSDSAMEASTGFDAAPAAGARVALFGPGGAVGAASVGTVNVTAENECPAWPSAQLTGAAGAWTVGFETTAAPPLPMRLDSAGVFTPADSARLAADLTRLASALPKDTSAGLHGVPFAVRDMRRFSPAPGVEAVVAAITRKLNVEANPRAEEIVLVAERDSAAPPDAFATAYYARSSAGEDDVQTTDFLAGARLGAARTPTLVLGRYLDEGTVYAVLQRAGAKRWRLRWTSAYAGC